jgi:hypothetical protein
MARSLRVLLLFVATLGSVSTLPPSIPSARAGELDKKGKADAKEAMRLYKEGNYEDAAKVFSRLSVAYPDMLVFVRNLGACYYYLRRWEPAISNLRDYEHRKKDIAPDDRAEVAGWIGEMERLRDMATLPPAPAPTAPEAAPPAATAPVAVAPVASPPATTLVPVPAPTMASPTTGPTPEPAPPASSAPAATPAPAAPAEAAPQPIPLQQSYPPSQYGQQPAYPPTGYGPQPGYPQAQYGAPPSGYPGAPYPSTAPGYPQVYPQGSYPPPAPAGEVAASPTPASSGSGRKVAAWILGITGVGAIAVGGLCTFKAIDDFSKVEKKYDPSVEDEGKKFATAQWVGYGVGGALLITAIIVGASGDSSSSGVALVPTAGPGTAGATLSGTF